MFFESIQSLSEMAGEDMLALFGSSFKKVSVSNGVLDRSIVTNKGF